MVRFFVGAAIIVPYLAGGVLVGFGERNENAGLSFIGLGLIGIGVVATFVLPGRFESKQRSDFGKLAPSLGMFYMDDDPYGLAQLDFESFRGKRGASAMVLEGDWHDVPMKGFAFRYLEQWNDAEGDRHTTAVTRSCALAQMTKPLPQQLPEGLAMWVHSAPKRWKFEVSSDKVLCIADDFVDPDEIRTLFDALKSFVDQIQAEYGPPVPPTMHQIPVT